MWSSELSWTGKKAHRIVQRNAVMFTMGRGQLSVAINQRDRQNTNSELTHVYRDEIVIE